MPWQSGRIWSPTTDSRVAIKAFGASLTSCAPPQVPQARAVILTAPGEEGQVDYRSGPMVGEAPSSQCRRSTSDFFSTSLTPRRPQDFQNWDAERSVSPLSRTHRFTLAAVYDLPFFKNGNWFMKNVVGNWGFS